MPDAGREGRAALAARQAAFTRAVVLGDPDPEGMDPQWVDFTRGGLVGKRWFAVRRHYPVLVTALDHEQPDGRGGAAHFHAWAAQHRATGGTPLGGRLDGLCFAVWLERHRLLPAVAGGEVAVRLLTTSIGQDGRPRPRRWWGVGVSRAAGVTVLGLGTAGHVRRILSRG